MHMLACSPPIHEHPTVSLPLQPNNYPLRNTLCLLPQLTLLGQSLRILWSIWVVLWVRTTVCGNPESPLVKMFIIVTVK